MRKAKLLGPTSLAVMLAMLLIPSPGAVARGDLYQSHDLNYEFETPAGWVTLPKNDSWDDFGIVVGAIRQLETLKSDEPAKGQGGWVHLAVLDLPDGKTLQDMANDEETRGFLMKRFAKKASAWPEVEVVFDTYDSGQEIAILKADGETPNLQGKKGPTRGVMIVSIAKKKLYLLRMYAWHTEFDAEGLKDDLDMIELSFENLDLRPEPEKDPESERPPPEAEPEDVPEGDEAEEKVFEDKLVGWKIVKPVGIKSRDDFDKDKYGDVVVWFEDNDHVGSYQFIFYVVKRGRQNPDTGLAIPDTNLRQWGIDPWWKSFDRSHPTGPVRTWQFPRKPKKILILPDWETEKEIFSSPKRRPRKPGKVKSSDLMKLKAVEKSKGERMGEEKVNEGFRGVLGGNRERSGREVVVRYVWGTARLTCFISISFSRDAIMKWGEKIDQMLQSIEMTGRYRGK